MARTAPFLEAFAAAQGCASSVFKVIDRASKIDSMSSDGKIMNFGVRGEIEFKDVHFCYPSRNDVKVIDAIFSA